MIEYYNKLSLYARGLGVPIHFKDVLPGTAFGSLGCFSIEKQEILISDKLHKDDPFTWYIICHEIGHYKDIEKHNTEDYTKAMMIAYWTLKNCIDYNISTPKEIQKFIMSAEVKAYKYGDKIVEKFNLPIIKRDMKKWKSRNLSLYRKSFSGAIKWNNY